MHTCRGYTSLSPVLKAGQEGSNTRLVTPDTFALKEQTEDLLPLFKTRKRLVFARYQVPQLHEDVGKTVGETSFRQR